MEKAEENSSGEEQWDINFRKHTQHTDSSSKKKKKKVSESSKKGGSLSNLSCLSDFEVSFSTFIACNFKTMILLHLNKNIKKMIVIIDKTPLQGSSGKSSKSKKGRSSVSSRSREGGSLPPTKFENVMLLEVRLPYTCTYKN